MTADPESSSSSTSAEIEKLRAANWCGSIPVSLSLAPSSLFSPTIPPPIHVLISRNTFLHVGLKHAVLRLHKFAPPTFSFTRKVIEEPESCLKDDDEDEDDNNNNNGENKKKENNGDDTTEKKEEKKPVEKEDVYPVCWFEDETTELPLRWQLFAGILFDSHHSKNGRHDEGPTKQPGLPWKIRVHFNQYPSSHLLQLEPDVLTTITKNFKHSLKQALVLQHGTNKVALNMTKQSHQQLWDSISSSKYSVYKLIQEDIQAKAAVESIPVRLLVGPSKPLVQKRCDDNSRTLGSLLLDWAPQYFEVKDNDAVQPRLAAISWRVSGVVPPLSTLLIDLWRTLCHPDSFLYICLLIP